jgi:hypothetical protein
MRIFMSGLQSGESSLQVFRPICCTHLLFLTGVLHSLTVSCSLISSSWQYLKSNTNYLSSSFHYFLKLLLISSLLDRNILLGNPFNPLFLFWKIKVSSSDHLVVYVSVCLHVYVCVYVCLYMYPPIDFWMAEPIFMKPGKYIMAPEAISSA